MGSTPGNSNLEAIADCALPQTYTKVHTFLSLVGHYRRFIKGFMHITQLLSEYLASEEASKKSEWVLLTENIMKAFKALKQVCMPAPILVFTDYTKPFLLETNASKDGLGAVLSQMQADRQYHPIAYGSRSLTPHKKNYHSNKLKFLALKKAVTEHFKEYLPYQSFVLWMDNNLLMYIKSTPNLDAMGHQFVGALAWFNLEYQKGHNNMVVDILSWVTTQLHLETVKSILDGVALGMVHWAKVHDWALLEGDQHLEQEVCVTAGHPLMEMHVTNWAEAQGEDLMLSAMLDQLKAQKQTDMRTHLVEHASSKEGKLILWNWQNFAIHQGALYLHSTPKGETEDLLLFVVPKAHHVATLNGCHQDAGHQGCDHTPSLLWECFWWQGMTNQVHKSLKSCMHCLQHEGKLSKVPLHPIVSTTPIDLLHVEFTSIEMTIELNRPPKVTNILVFQDHFMKPVMAYVTPNQTANTVAKFLYQGYILIFGALARLLSDHGANFMSNIIIEMCKLLSMKKLWTKPYHP